MDEIDFLRKINLVFKHNQINRLKKENEQKDKKIKLISKEGKRIFDEYKEEKNNTINQLASEIKELEEKCSKLENESNYYKNQLDSIPKFIKRIFLNKKSKKFNMISE